jgi:hypothetical protein
MNLESFISYLFSSCFPILKAQKGGMTLYHIGYVEIGKHTSVT